MISVSGNEMFICMFAVHMCKSHYRFKIDGVQHVSKLEIEKKNIFEKPKINKCKSV